MFLETLTAQTRCDLTLGLAELMAELTIRVCKAPSVTTCKQYGMASKG